MTTEFLYDFISRHRYLVLSTVTLHNLPEAAIVGFAATEDLKIIFDTVTTSRKYQNLLNNPYIALVIGWDNYQTLQYEGIAKIPTEDELDDLLEVYFKAFPDGKQRKDNWKDITYFCIHPKWIRYSDFNDPPMIEEKLF